MKYFGIEYYEALFDIKRYATPVVRKGQILNFLFDDETPVLPGGKRMTKGEYIVLSVDTSMCSKDRFVYRLVKNRKKSKYSWHIYTIPIDKAIEAGVVQICA
jgi:hypothetical protein